MGVLIGVLAVSLFMDMRMYKIPNICILTGMIAGFYFTHSSGGIASLFGCIVEMAIIFAAFYPFYLIRGIGAGDVKLLMMTAGYFHGRQLFTYIFVTMILAAAISVVKILFFDECRGRLIYLCRYVKKAVVTGTIDEYKIDNNNKRCVIRLSIPAFIAVLVMLSGY